MGSDNVAKTVQMCHLGVGVGGVFHTFVLAKAFWAFYFYPRKRLAEVQSEWRAFVGPSSAGGSRGSRSLSSRPYA